ncbi:MAG: FemAB family PEP-CTERM system-associated protein [Gammaproteobacteria bacterium]|nr:MAG: FemAB family PEP-CTERM system-associated protein [Gammaproteobacteria bacterium]
MELKVRELTEVDFERWDSFVESHPGATFFHRAAWKTVLERAFGHSSFYLYAERNGAIEGLLPLARIKSLLFGDTLISTPFCAYGGIVADNENAASTLRQAACDLAERLNVGSLELRNRQPSGENWPTKDLYAAFRKEIAPDIEANMMAIPRKQRAMVRKGIKAGLHSEVDKGCERINRIYAESVRNLGTPVFPAKYFRTLREVFGSDCGVLMVTHGQQDIAGVMSFYFRDEVIPYYGGSLPVSRALKGNDFMYWELMKRSCEQGIRTFDYGRSKIGTGPYSFKKNWGFTPEPLHYEYYLVKSDRIPEVNPMNPKYQMFIKAWRKLPLPMANFIGPMLARNLG